ncbi:DUF4059 family protein [Streptococcus sp. NLN64]|uniref:DUF4059 family protein n=1 Tax=Streptococcus sp. NLN64 TaxID=2822799 RepID=UPI0018CA3875|nr:DUF4059 family protein [Streptococcus sp. NLN64]MBG9367244.1 DUF4059 family protein [Streptococcus sp. NLN64]
MMRLYFQSLLITTVGTMVLALFFYFRGLGKGRSKREMRHEVFIASCLVIPIFSFAVMALLIVL